MAGDPGAVPGLIDEARTTLEAMGDRSLEAELEHARGTALVRAGAFAEAADVSERAATIALMAGRPQVAALAMLTAAAAGASVGDFERVVAITGTVAERPWPGRSLDSQVRSARAYALTRLGRMHEAIEAATQNLDIAGAGPARDRAVAELDLGTILLAAGSPAAAIPRLDAALAVTDAAIPRAATRLVLAEALVRAGEPDRAESELGRVPFEPVRAADAPQTLVGRLARVQGLVAAARGDATLAERRFAEAERVWQRLSASPSGDDYVAVLVDLGRPPVAGLVEPARELERLAHDRTSMEVRR